MNVNKIAKLIQVGKSLTTEKNQDILKEIILSAAKELSNADAGTLYLVSEDEQYLKFEVVQTDSLNIRLGGTEGKISWPNLPIYTQEGKPNTQMVAVTCALEGKFINIEDIYTSKSFNFEGAKKFDSANGYTTKSMIVVPLRDHEDHIIGVLQLLNKLDENGRIIPFNKEDQEIIESMSSQAAISITNNRLIVGLENLLDSFIKSIATAINEKSAYTGGHISRVEEIVGMFMEALNKDENTFKDIYFSKNDMKQMSRAAWLHDLGKIVTPEHIIDKGKKLETVFDRIELIKARFEILKRDLELEYLKKIAAEPDTLIQNELTKNYYSQVKLLQEDINFIVSCNTGGEFMSDEYIQKIQSLAQKTILINEEEHNLISDDEAYNLSIRKGTLTNEERDIINNHVIVTYKILDSLPFPKKLRRIPTIAGSHHKKINGGGYAAKEIFELPMSTEDKILAIADVFEALTACDRPYKKANSLNSSLRILSFMIKDGELDEELIKFFIHNNLHLEYAYKYLQKEQIDKITIKF